jgi:hypothetical protein
MPSTEYKIYFDGRCHATAYSWNDVEFYKQVAEFGGFKFEVEEISLI